MHRLEHIRMLAHAEIVIRAPDGDIALQTMMVSVGKLSGMTLELGKMPVAAIGLEAVQSCLEILVVDCIHLRHLVIPSCLTIAQNS